MESTNLFINQLEDKPQNQTQGQGQLSVPMEYAGFWVRLFAQILDTLFWLLNFFVPLYILSEFGVWSLKVFVPSFLWFVLYMFFIGPLIKFFVHPWLVSEFGAGVGKILCGLEIVNYKNERLKLKDALFREYIAKSASNAFFGLGYFWIFRSPQRQGWHDGFSGTFVVKKRSGLLTGFLFLGVMLVLIFALCFKTISNFREAKTLGYDLITLINQTKQDLIQ